jgi:iron-sulfur cluster repair protein YtfE (RIC family)
MKLNLTRDQLATFLSDHEQIKQFENLFAVVDELQVITGTDFEYQADTAAATANEALAQIIALAQDVAINSGNADQKAIQALAELNRLAQELNSLAKELQLLFTAPVVENNNSVKTDYIDLRQNAPYTDSIGRLAWNNTDQTANLGMDYGVVQQIGQETYARVI